MQRSREWGLMSVNQGAAMIPEGSKRVARGKAAKQTPPLECFEAVVLPRSHAGGMREAFVNPA